MIVGRPGDGCFQHYDLALKLITKPEYIILRYIFTYGEIQT